MEKTSYITCLTNNEELSFLKVFFLLWSALEISLFLSVSTLGHIYWFLSSPAPPWILKTLLFFLFCFVCFGNTGCWTQGPTLVRQAPYHLSHFCVGYFWQRVSHTLCSGQPQTSILPVSASQVARSTSLSHSTWLYAVLFVYNPVLFILLVQINISTLLTESVFLRC
jgi:hypothetical protein